MKKQISIILIMMLVLGIGMPLKAYADIDIGPGENIEIIPGPGLGQGGQGEVIQGFSMIQPQLTLKTLDLTESNINISLTQKDIDKLYDEAEKLTFNWLQCVIIFSGSPGDVEGEWIKAGKFEEMYWFRELPNEKQMSPQYKSLLAKVRELGSITAVLKNESILTDLNENNVFSRDEIENTLRGKVEETANYLISDKLTSQMQKNSVVSALTL